MAEQTDHTEERSTQGQTDHAERRSLSGRIASGIDRFERLGTPERIAVGAGAIGFGLSLFFLYLYSAVGDGGAAGLELRASLETVFIFFWPSAILLTATQTLQGGIALFLLSASLNAVYYVFVSLAVYALHKKFSEKLESFNTFVHSSNAATPATVRAATFRAYRAPKLIQRITTRSS